MQTTKTTVSADLTEFEEPEARLSWLLQYARDIPPLPRVAVQVANLVDQPNTSAAQVAQALSMDQVLTARVLKLANSAFYGAPRKISTVTEAIVLLGMRTIRNMTMAVSCFDLYDRDVKGYTERRGDMWRHSLCCGYAAQQIAARVRYPLPEEAFVAGLLHDIGKVLISLRLSNEFGMALDRVIEEKITFVEAELEILGFDHAQVGAHMSEAWNLPPQLVSAIRWHHDPASAVETPPAGNKSGRNAGKLAAIVHVSDLVCITLGIGLGGDGLHYRLQEGVLDLLGLDAEAIDGFLMIVSDFVGQPDSLLKLGS